MASHCTPLGLLSFGMDKGMMRERRKWSHILFHQQSRQNHHAQTYRDE